LTTPQSIPPAAPIGAKLITPIELAELYRIPTATAAKWRWNGTGPAFVKFGSRVLYRETDVEAWIASNLRTSTAANE
jgi:predicted DNA-binding transcriptional regulator AlpA